ncbi:MAG: RNA polymerase sigma factor [Planctomycetota bacterium]
MASHSFDERLISHRSWLQSVIRSRVRETDAVDELVNDVIAEAIAVRRRDEQENRDSVRELAPWLYRVAIHKVLQFRRSSARRRKHQQAYSAESVTRAEQQWQQEPFESLLGNERQQLVRVALQRMKGQDAEILVLKYVHRWNYQQIAAHLGLTHSKVTHRLRRARGRLKAELCRLGLGENHER